MDDTKGRCNYCRVSASDCCDYCDLLLCDKCQDMYNISYTYCNTCHLRVHYEGDRSCLESERTGDQCVDCGFA